MKIRYGLVDSDDTPVFIEYDQDNGSCEIYNTENKQVMFKEQYVAEGELRNIERIMKNNDYYDVYVSAMVELPLKVAKYEYTKKLIEVI